MKTMGIGWVSSEGKRFDYQPKEPGEHQRLIVTALRDKLRQNPEVKKILLATGNLILKPDHHQEPDVPAAWRYCEIGCSSARNCRGSRRINHMPVIRGQK